MRPAAHFAVGACAGDCHTIRRDGIRPPESSMRQPTAVLAVLAAVACHPAAHNAEHAVAPDSAVEPVVACVRSALGASPNIAEIRPSDDHPRTASVIFVNPPGPGVGGMAVVVAPSRGTPSQFVAEYTLWVGDPGKSGNGDNSGGAVADAASRLLLEASTRCAPAAA